MVDEQRFSGKMGEEYDLLKKAYPKYEELHQVLADAISDHSSGEDGGKLQVLEIGCGSGITSSAILGAGKELSLTSIDSEPKMISQASLNLKRDLQGGRLTLIQADALEFLESTGDATLDIVASGFTFHNFLREYRSSVLDQTFRVLKPGGLFVNADKYSLEGQEMFNELVLQLQRFFNAFVPLGKLELLQEWVLHNVADQAPDRAMREKDSVKEMEEIGFQNVQVHFRHGLEAVVSGRKAEARSQKVNMISFKALN